MMPLPEKGFFPDKNKGLQGTLIPTEQAYVCNTVIHFG